jgi:membrane protein implicated in regulation of membrane protease activity
VSAGFPTVIAHEVAMAFEIAYWHWLIFGMALLIAEMFLGSMTILWFGLGALVIAALVFFVEDVVLTWQLFIWLAHLPVVQVFQALHGRPHQGRHLP